MDDDDQTLIDAIAREVCRSEEFNWEDWQGLARTAIRMTRKHDNRGALPDPERTVRAAFSDEFGNPEYVRDDGDGVVTIDAQIDWPRLVRLIRRETPLPDDGEASPSAPATPAATPAATPRG